VIESQEPELAAAIRAGAQARVNQLKAQLTNQVANRVASQLNRSFSFYDDWFDPLVVLRGRFNLSKAFYLTAEHFCHHSDSDVDNHYRCGDLQWDSPYRSRACNYDVATYTTRGKQIVN
jgi:hypothetical protein